MVLLATCWLLVFNFASAQTLPQFLVSWQAQNYAPSWYQGKLLPINGTPVEIKFELIESGKLADLSKIKVRWYVNDGLVKNEENGLGIKSLKFNIPDYGGNETEVRISLPEYKNYPPLDYIMRIPVKNPEVVINNRYPKSEINKKNISFEALPFFFNINSLNNLSFNWSAAGQESENYTENPWLFKLNVDSQAPSGFIVSLRVSVQNLLNQMEFASKDLRLVIK